ncbi:MAG: hypothetical protein IT539_13800 [Bradyrhizobiaceae bacterium]|nr:hypothetical protein [Bradyrhizobiaceae bacterium]
MTELMTFKRFRDELPEVPDEVWREAIPGWGESVPKWVQEEMRRHARMLCAVLLEPALYGDLPADVDHRKMPKRFGGQKEFAGEWKRLPENVQKAVHFFLMAAEWEFDRWRYEKLARFDCLPGAPFKSMAAYDRAVAELERGEARIRKLEEAYPHLTFAQMGQVIKGGIEIERALRADLIGGLRLILKRLDIRNEDGSPVSLEEFSQAYLAAKQTADAGRMAPASAVN